MSEQPPAPRREDPWSAASRRSRQDVRRAFAPRPRRCGACGAQTTTASRTCPACGAPYVAYRTARWTRRTRRLLAGTVIAAVALGVAGFFVLGPGIRHAKQERAAQARDSLDRARAHERARLTRLQRVRVARAAPAPAGDLVARRALVAELRARIEADARARARRGELPGPVRAAECTPWPSGTRDAALDARARVGRYACTAIIDDVVGGSAPAQRAVIGDPFWARVWFSRGALVWCAITPRGGERVAGLELATVPLAAACDLGDDAGDGRPPRRP